MTHGLRPIAYIIAGMTIIGFVDNFVCLIAPEMSLWQFHFTRSAMALPVLFGIGLVAGWRLRPIRFWYVLARNIFLAVAMVIYFGCLGYMPIANVVAGIFTAPILVMVIDAIWSRRGIGPYRIMAALVGFVGALLVLGFDLPGLVFGADPTGEDVTGRSWIALTPILAGLSYAFGNVATRKWCEGESTFAMLWSYMAIVGVIGAAAMIWITLLGAGDTYLTQGWAWPPGYVWWLVVLQAVLSLLGIGLVTQAYLIGDATRVTIFEYTLMIAASGTAWLMFGEALGVTALIGIGFILISGVVIAVRER